MCNFGGKMEKKMLREITNDKFTPKKRDFMVETELFDGKVDDEYWEGLDYDDQSSGPIPLAEF